MIPKNVYLNVSENQTGTNTISVIFQQRRKASDRTFVSMFSNYVTLNRIPETT